MAEADDTNYSRRVTKSKTSTNSELETHIEQGKEKNIFRRVTKSMTKASRTEEIVEYHNNEENNEKTVSFVDKEDKGATRSINSNLKSYTGKNKGEEDQNRRVTRSMTKAIRTEENFKHQINEASEKEDENKDDIIKASLSEEISYPDGNEDQEKANSINESLFIKSKKKEENFSLAESEEQECTSQREDIGVISHNEKNINIQTNLFAKEDNKEKIITAKETLDCENEDRRIKIYQKEDEETEKSEEKEKENFSVTESEKQNEENNSQQEDTGVATASLNEENTNIQTDKFGNEENKKITITTKETEFENEDQTKKTYQHEGVDVNKNEERLDVNITQLSQNEENFNYKSNECEDKGETSFVNEKSETENESELTKWKINEKIISDTEKDQHEEEERKTENEKETTISDDTKKEQNEKKEITKNMGYASQLQNNLQFEDNTACASQKNVIFDIVFDKSAEAKETTTSVNTKNFDNDEDKTAKRCQEKEDTIFSSEKEDYNEEIRFTRSTSQYEDCINLKDSLTKVSQNEEMSNSQSDIKEEMISSNKVDNALKDNKKSTKCDSQLKDVVITIEEDIKDEELKSTENLFYNSKSKFSIIAYKSNFEPCPTNSENKRNDLYVDLKDKLSHLNKKLEDGLKSTGKDTHRQYSLISLAHKILEDIKNIKKQLPLSYQRKLQDRIDKFEGKFIKRFEECGFGKQMEMYCFSHENKNCCEMQVVSAGSWRQSKELNRDRDSDYGLDRDFQQLNTRSESHGVDMEQGTNHDNCQRPQRGTVYPNETTKKIQTKNNNTPRVHSYTDSTLTQLDQACQTSFCEEQKSPPRRTIPSLDKEYPIDDVARRIRNSSPTKEVQTATSSYSMLKSSKEVKDNPYPRAQSVREISQNKNVKSFQPVRQPNYETKDPKSYLKSSSCNKTPEDMRNFINARTKSQSDQVMESVESNNTLIPENNQTQHILARQQHSLQDDSKKVKYFNQSKEKMDLQDRKLEGEERIKDTEGHLKTNLEYTSGETFIQHFQQREELERKIVLLEHQQLEQHQMRIDEKIAKDNSLNYNTRLSGSTLEPRGLEKEVNRRTHPLYIDDKRISSHSYPAHAYKKNYLKDSASPDFAEGAVSYHRYQHRKSPEIVNMSSYQQRRSSPSFVNQCENIERKQQITPTPNSRNYHQKEQEYQDLHLYQYARTVNSEEKIMKEKQFRQQYQTNYSYDNSNNQAYFNEEQRYIQGNNYQQHQKRILESYHSSHGHTFNEALPEMMRRQEIEVAQEVEEEPLEIVDVHQYFSGDYDLKTLDDSVDIKTQIETVEKWAQTFEDKVNTFSGEKFSLEYFVLDEKLMRLIEHLDKLKCHEDQATTARKIEVIQYIKRLHSILDSNAKDE